MTLRIWMALITLFVFLGSCASSTTTTKPANNNRNNPVAIKVDESFDPLSLQDEDITFPTENNRVDDPNRDPIQLPKTTGNREIDGFRVQIFATREIERATAEKRQAEYQFANITDPAAVYIIFDSPMWKVRVGDCRSRQEAEELRINARQNGYSKAFIVKDKVNTTPDLPFTDDQGNNR